ncbi:hypothetical protein [Pasteuria penetrans]|uniref:hypothetical protein n=1 Tax=Pasteuria penetrans TaxID=86005 RepID=UPI000FADA01B|nr:hypothetical protein [Pasteuria penetrans]
MRIPYKVIASTMALGTIAAAAFSPSSPASASRITATAYSNCDYSPYSYCVSSYQQLPYPVIYQPTQVSYYVNNFPVQWQNRVSIFNIHTQRVEYHYKLNINNSIYFVPENVYQRFA